MDAIAFLARARKLCSKLRNAARLRACPASPTITTKKVRLVFSRFRVCRCARSVPVWRFVVVVGIVVVVVVLVALCRCSAAGGGEVDFMLQVTRDGREDQEMQRRG